MSTKNPNDRVTPTMINALRWLLACLLLGGFLTAFAQTGSNAAKEHRAPARFDHVKTGFPLSGQHILVSCESCHISGIFKGTPRNCEGCHIAGGRAGVSVKPSGHISTTAVCDNCHKSTSTWAGAIFSHTGIVSGCTTCHNGTTATGKVSGHIVTTASCDTCHRTTAWSPTTFKHGDIAPGSCSTCHNGTKATGKPGRHASTTAACDSCHKSTSSWAGASFSHTGIVSGCATCHNGTTALGKPGSHVPTTSWPACESCHKSTASFANARVHGSVVVAPGSCSTCHNGTMATGKSGGHASTTAACDSCHKSTSSWAGASFSHTGIVSGCATCHNGTTALGKPGSHVPTTSWPACESCHKSTASFANALLHSSVVVAPGSCLACHNGTMATGKPGNHIPEAQLGASMACDACHTSKTSWVAIKMNHNGSSGNGMGWCKSCHASGASYLGSMDKKSLTHEAKSGTSPTDCSMSGCHRPLGSKGSAYSNWD